MARQNNSSTEEFNFEEDISINKHRLDREFVTHSRKHIKYAELAAQATKEAARAHEKVKVIRSEIIIEILAEGSKPTGAVLEARYRTDTRHKKAKEEHIEAEETTQLLNEAVLAFRARKSALENLVHLKLSGYFSSPQAPEGSDVGSDESIKEAAKEKAQQKADRRSK